MNRHMHCQLTRNQIAPAPPASHGDLDICLSKESSLWWAHVQAPPKGGGYKNTRGLWSHAASITLPPWSCTTYFQDSLAPKLASHDARDTGITCRWLGGNHTILQKCVDILSWRDPNHNVLLLLCCLLWLWGLGLLPLDPERQEWPIKSSGAPMRGPFRTRVMFKFDNNAF